MNDEAQLRLIAFLSILTTVILWEIVAPRRRLTQSIRKRWLNNISLVAANSLMVRLLLPMGTAGIALWAEQKQLGIFHYLHLPTTLSIILSIILLDLIIYWQHRLFHRIPLLWRLHQVHHADQDIDVTTGLRFHPIEILISMLIKLTAIALLGAPVMAVILFEAILNGMAMFNHGNIRISSKLDNILRLFVVTPDMHRVHHSVLIQETNSNYGFNISLWDRLFHSYRAQPEAGHSKMQIGLKELDNQPTHSILWMLQLPFIYNGGQYAARQNKTSEDNNV